MTIREMMITRLLSTGWGRYTQPKPEEVDCMRKHYEEMSNKDLYDEFAADVYKDGQDSMSI